MFTPECAIIYNVGKQKDVSKTIFVNFPDTHGSQYSTQNSLTAKDGNIYSQPHSTYSSKYYSGNASGSHNSVSQRLNFDNMPSQNR